MRKSIFVLLIIGTWVAHAQEGAAPQKPVALADDVPKLTAEQPMSVWMERKLGYSQDLLKALAMGDFDSMELNAERMQLISKIEGFVRKQNVSYTTQLRVFELANRDLIRQAKKKNIEGATLAFQQLTSSCVACHVTLREPANAEDEVAPSDD